MDSWLLLAPVGMALLDRLRGDKFGLPKAIEALAYGWLALAIVGLGWEVITPYATAGFAVGASWGWGCPYGAALSRKPMKLAEIEWWQAGILKTNTLAAIITRGVMWGMPLLIVAAFFRSLDVAAVGVAMTLAFPIAVYATTDWEESEYIRGFIAGCFLVLYKIF